MRHCDHASTATLPASDTHPLRFVSPVFETRPEAAEWPTPTPSQKEAWMRDHERYGAMRYESFVALAVTLVSQHPCFYIEPHESIVIW